MSNPFSLVLDTTANEGQLDNVKNIISDLVTDVHSNEPDTIFYRCFVDDATNRICFLDTYASSEAFLAHAGRPAVKQALDAIMANVTPNGFTVFGEVTPEARSALEGLGATILPQLAGFDRSQVIATS